MIRKVIIVVLTLAAVGIAVVGAASFRARSSQFDRDRLITSRLCSCTSRDGVLTFLVSNCPTCGAYGEHSSTCKWARRRVNPRKPLPITDLKLGQFRWRVTETVVSRAYYLKLPTWFPMLVFAAYPTIAFIRGPVRRYRRRRNGLCVKCGYNLTGNVSGVCPECGTVVKQP